LKRGSALLAEKLLRGGSCDSVEYLKKKMLNFIAYFNETMAHPYDWTYAKGALKKQT